MRETILYIASSLDGYIAREDGSVDWLEQFPNPDENDYGYTAFLAGCDTLVMGAGTYTTVLSFGIEWPYADKDVYVLSSRTGLEITTPRTQRVPDMESWIRTKNELAGKDGNCWLLGGGKLVRSFLEYRAIDRILLTQFPILLGAGIPLFPATFPMSSWRSEKVQVYASGAVGFDLVPDNSAR